jgi:hypothetical protein
MSSAKRKKLNTGASQPVSTTAVDPTVRHRANVLYESCLTAKPIEEEHSIAEMLTYGVTHDENELAILCQENLNSDLFMPFKKTSRNEMVYRLRPKSEAIKSACPCSCSCSCPCPCTQSSSLPADLFFP